MSITRRMDKSLVSVFLKESGVGALANELRIDAQVVLEATHNEHRRGAYPHAKVNWADFSVGSVYVQFDPENEISYRVILTGCHCRDSQLVDHFRSELKAKGWGNVSVKMEW